MASTSETGHAKNVANLSRLLTCCTSYGDAYNPSKPAISVEGLTTLEKESKETLNLVKQAASAHSNAIAAREELFATFGKFVTRIFNALKASGSSTEIDEKVSAIVQKIQGRRATAKLTEEEKKELEAQGKSTKEISSSQLSYDNRIDNFGKLLALLETIPAYNPNEADLKIASLKTYNNNLKSKNDAVIDTETNLKSAMIKRNELFYNDITGMVDLTVDAKNYVKSVFGSGTQQYKQVSAIEFRKYKS